MEKKIKLIIIIPLSVFIGLFIFPIFFGGLFLGFGVYIGPIVCPVIGYLLVRYSEKNKKVTEKDLEISAEEKVKRSKRDSMNLFIVGSIIVGISCLVFLFDSVFMLAGSGWSGIFSYIVIPLYFFAILLIVYSIHLAGNMWGWLDFPIALVICLIALFQILFSRQPNEFGYRLTWFLIYPLNYMVLLILFVIIIRSKQVTLEE
jgi:MFS family permease